ncbi:MAG: four helix bundle protein [Pyrinomonadaceae bacterium]|nr:four helix bundle protein [Pyrinomonadaceae bacterium]
MAKIEKFEDIKSWQLARKVSNRIYEVSKTGEFARDFALRDQMRRSSVSIMSNIAEGFEREGNKEFINFLTIAKASCAESRSQLYLALDQKYLTQEQFNEIYRELNEVGNLLGGFIKYLRNSDLKGSKFKEGTLNSKP